MPDLKGEEISYLSEKFSFTGGQIDNVFPKYVLKGIIYENQPGITQIERICLEEIFGIDTGTIGF